MTFEEACKKAKAYRDGCTRHVNATVCPGKDSEAHPCLAWDGYTVSDWYVDGLTVRSYTDGQESIPYYGAYS